MEPAQAAYQTFLDVQSSGGKIVLTPDDQLELHLPPDLGVNVELLRSLREELISVLKRRAYILERFSESLLRADASGKYDFYIDTPESELACSRMDEALFGFVAGTSDLNAVEKAFRALCRTKRRKETSDGTTH